MPANILFNRYLDLIMNDKSRDVFVTRSKIVKYIRRYFVSPTLLELMSKN